HGERATARGVNYRFHRRLYDIAKMPQTLHFVQILWARYPFDLINAAHGRRQDAVKEHDDILNALTAGDVSAAMLAMRKHIESGWTVLKSM
ncbi:MAG TPA: FCD domain-containing protein, partial [Bordetella sp.]|nr:FCD domain-containing protein [Bordetella sp.]